MTDAARDTRQPRRPTPTQIPIAPRVEDPESDARELAGRIEQVARGGARAGLLGISDGLVTNICLILAVAGAQASSTNVRLAGFASLIAGSFSMAAGEWISVRSQAELLNGLLSDVRRLIARNPGLVLGALATNLEDAGLSHSTARLAAAELPLDEPSFMSFTARVVFGVDTGSVGSPRTAAVSSFVFFGLGALVPLLPWFFIHGTAATITSVVATTFVSLIVGAFVGRSSGRSVAWGAARQLAIVAVASAVTYGIGRAFGTTIS